MPRRRKHRHQIPTNHRRKCVDTGTVKQVVCRHITIPAEFTSPKKLQKKLTEKVRLPTIILKMILRDEETKTKEV